MEEVEVLLPSSPAAAKASVLSPVEWQPMEELRTWQEEHAQAAAMVHGVDTVVVLGRRQPFYVLGPSTHLGSTLCCCFG